MMKFRRNAMLFAAMLTIPLAAQQVQPAAQGATLEQTTDFLNTMAARLGKPWKMSVQGCQVTIRSESANTGQKVVRLINLLLDQSDPLSTAIAVQDSSLKKLATTEVPPKSWPNSSDELPLYTVTINKAVFAGQEAAVPGPTVEWQTWQFYHPSGGLAIVESVTATDFVVTAGGQGRVHIPFDRYSEIYASPIFLYQYEQPSGKKKVENALPPLTSFMSAGDVVFVGMYTSSGSPSSGLSVTKYPVSPESSAWAAALKKAANTDPEVMTAETMHPGADWQPLVLLTGLDKETADRVAKATVHALVLCQKDKAPSPF
jgi:hypothetical protein